MKEEGSPGGIPPSIPSSLNPYSYLISTIILVIVMLPVPSLESRPRTESEGRTWSRQK